MDIKTLMKLSLMGLLALSFAAPMGDAKDKDDDDTEEVAPKKKKAKKSKKKEAAATRMVVAIHKFENKSSAPDSVFETIRSRVQQCVVGARKYDVVEREQMKAAMSEQALAASGVTNSEDADAPEAGKMKAAGYIIYGTVLYCDVDKTVGGGDDVAAAKNTAKVELQIKITDAESGKILTQKSAIGYGISTQVATEGYQSASNQGMRDAIDEAAHMAADALRDVAYPAKIVRVGKRDITVNLTDEEAKEDDVFDVIDAEDLGIDQDTGKWLGFDGDDVGRFVITRTGGINFLMPPILTCRTRTLNLGRKASR